VDTEKEHNLFTATLGLGMLLALSAFALSYFGAWYFKNPELVALTQFTAITYILSSLTIVPYNVLNRDMRFKERGLLDMYSVIASITVQMALAWLGFGVWTLLWGSVVRFFMRLSLAFFYSGYRPRLRFNWALMKSDIGFSAQLTLNWFLSVLKDRSLTIIIGRIYSVSQLGMLGFAGTLSGIPNLKIVQLLREVLLPLLSKRYNNPRSQLGGLATALRVMALLILPIYLCGWYFGEAALACILPSKWTAMFPLFEVLCLVQMWNVLASIVSIYNTAQSRPSRSTWFELSMALIVPAATLIFRSVDLFHLAHLWSAIGGAVFVVWFILQFRGEREFMRRFAGQVLSMALVCAALFCLDKAVAPFAAAHMGRTPAAWASLAARIALFLSGYGLYLRLAHWDFLIGLRKK
jgi:O-antigen/teichoic acid export membrane protein